MGSLKLVYLNWYTSIHGRAKRKYVKRGKLRKQIIRKTEEKTKLSKQILAGKKTEKKEAKRQALKMV